MRRPGQRCISDRGKGKQRKKGRTFFAQGTAAAAQKALECEDVGICGVGTVRDMVGIDQGKVIADGVLSKGSDFGSGIVDGKGRALIHISEPTRLRRIS